MKFLWFAKKQLRHKIKKLVRDKSLKRFSEVNKACVLMSNIDNEKYHLFQKVKRRLLQAGIKHIYLIATSNDKGVLETQANTKSENELFISPKDVNIFGTVNSTKFKNWLTFPFDALINIDSKPSAFEITTFFELSKSTFKISRQYDKGADFILRVDEQMNTEGFLEGVNETLIMLTKNKYNE